MARELGVNLRLKDLFTGPLKSAGKELDKFGKSGEKSVGGLAKSLFSAVTSLKGLTTIGTVAFFGKLAADAREADKELIRLNNQYGISIERLAQFRTQAAFSGVSLERFIDGLKDAQIKLLDFAVTGGGEAKDLFGLVPGLKEAAENGAQFDDILAALRGSVGKLSDEELTFTLDLLGSDALVESAALIKKTVDEIERLDNLSAQYGPTEEDLEATKRYTAEAARLGVVFEGIERSVGRRLNLGFAGLFEGISDATIALSDFFELGNTQARLARDATEATKEQFEAITNVKKAFEDSVKARANLTKLQVEEAANDKRILELRKEIANLEFISRGEDIFTNEIKSANVELAFRSEKSKEITASIQEQIPLYQKLVEAETLRAQEIRGAAVEAEKLKKQLEDQKKAGDLIVKTVLDSESLAFAREQLAEFFRAVELEQLGPKTFANDLKQIGLGFVDAAASASPAINEMTRNLQDLQDKVRGVAEESGFELKAEGFFDSFIRQSKELEDEFQPFRNFFEQVDEAKAKARNFFQTLNGLQAELSSQAESNPALAGVISQSIAQDGINAYRALAAEAKAYFEEVKKAQELEQRRSIPAALDRVVERYKDLSSLGNIFTNSVDVLRDGLGTGLGGVLDALGDKTKDVGDAFEDMVQGMLQQLAQLALNSALDQVFSTGLSFLQSAFSPTSAVGNVAATIGPNYKGTNNDGITINISGEDVSSKVGSELERRGRRIAELVKSEQLKDSRLR